MKLEDIWKTAVMTLFGLYKWIVIPMGLQNSPPIHQHWVTTALRHLIGDICHMYVDDVVIWLKTIANHTWDIWWVLKALCASGLYLNPKKWCFYQMDIDFLSHHISTREIEANSLKVDKILNWLVPKSTTNVRLFLGLVHSISVYLLNLAGHTCVLTPLTTKAAKTDFWCGQMNTRRRSKRSRILWLPGSVSLSSTTLTLGNTRFLWHVMWVIGVPGVFSVSGLHGKQCGP